jgi:hypothetical protein
MGTGNTKRRCEPAQMSFMRTLSGVMRKDNVKRKLGSVNTVQEMKGNVKRWKEHRSRVSAYTRICYVSFYEPDRK